MGIKYYHSAPQQIRMVPFIADAEGKLVYQFGNSEFVKNLPRVTVCTILDGNKLSIGYTTCSDKDQYKKKIGQRISYIRALKRPFAVVEIPNMQEIHDISLKYVEQIFDIETKRIYGVSS